VIAETIAKFETRHLLKRVPIPYSIHGLIRHLSNGHLLRLDEDCTHSVEYRRSQQSNERS
jgi:hypothetical protein